MLCNSISGDDSGSGGPGSLDLRASAIAAVDAAENSLKEKVSKGGENTLVPSLGSGPGVRVPTPGVSAGVNAVNLLGTGTLGGETELSSELSNFPDIVTNVKLVSLQAPPGATIATSTSTPSSTLTKPLPGSSPY